MEEEEEGVKKTTKKLGVIESKLNTLPAIDSDYETYPVKNKDAKKATELTKGVEIGEKTMFTGDAFFDAGLVYGRNREKRQENRAKRKANSNAKQSYKSELKSIKRQNKNK